MPGRRRSLGRGRRCPGRRCLAALAHGGRAAVIAVDSGDVTAPVFNLRVARLHTYAVGESGVLVHNKAMPRKPGSLGKFKGTHALRRENARTRLCAMSPESST